MAKLLPSTVSPIIALCLALFSFGGDALQRRSQVRSASEGLSDPAVGYVVPVEGAYEKLPFPRPGSALTFLTLARGNISYSCADRKPAQSPVYTSQFTTLWDAAPLIPHIADESQFHTIIPQLFAFDYTKIANSSLVCIGTIGTVHSQPIVDIFALGMFRLDIQKTIQGPEGSESYLDWAYEMSDDQHWEVYRVEIISDHLPQSCEKLDENFTVSYAAEYWFFHD